LTLEELPYVSGGGAVFGANSDVEAEGGGGEGGDEGEGGEGGDPSSVNEGNGPSPNGGSNPPTQPNPQKSQDGPPVSVGPGVQIVPFVEYTGPDTKPSPNGGGVKVKIKF